ncbi:MAG: DNA polymerase III subunit gamma/tau [Tissierellia bacterium]|nr:DNA polymerase III subunit gamma/tau [Tissierellia bacterium]
MYQALYRKYRSKTFDELVGQTSIVNALKNQVINQEISHAYLFSGTRGTGKTSAAKILSRAVNCENPQEGNPCNHCDCCVSILKDTQMDVVEMDAASNNGVDDIRELKEKVIYPPSSLKYKVYIIDEVHMLSKGAFNALLKILEEPPKHLIFILATTEPEKIPQTILSRTQKFNFKRIPVNIIIENLKKIIQEENKSCDEEVLSLIAKNADGAMRDALSVFDQLLSYSQEHISYELAIEILGIASKDLIFDLAEGLLNKNVNHAINALDHLSQEGKDYITLNRDLLSHFRDLMLIKTLKDSSDLVLTSYREEFIEQGKKSSLDRILYIIDQLKEVHKSIRYVDDPKILMEMNVVKICTHDDRKDLEKRMSILEEKIRQGFSVGRQVDGDCPTKEDVQLTNSGNFSIEQRKILDAPETIVQQFGERKSSENIKTGKTPFSEKAKIENEENSDIIDNADLNIDQITKDWNRILEDMKAMRRINVAALLKEAKPLSFKNQILEIGFQEKFEFHVNAISTKDNLTFISHVLEERYGVKIEVRVVIEREDSEKKLYDLFGKENIEIIN